MQVSKWVRVDKEEAETFTITEGSNVVVLKKDEARKIRDYITQKLQPKGEQNVKR